MGYTKNACMNSISLKQLIIFFAVITAVIAAFIVGANLFLKWGIQVEPPKNEIKLEDVPTGAVKIKPANEVELTPAVIYDGNSFKPSRVIRDGSGSVGCLVVLVNRSGAILKIGLNPHNPVRDPGPDFGFTASNDKLIFDPRFNGIIELKVHNHEKPGEGFTVILGPKCQL